MGNVEYREGWIDEGLTTFIANDMALMNADLASWEKTRAHSDENVSGAGYRKSRTTIDAQTERENIGDREHCYLNQPYGVVDERDNPGDKEYLYTPIFLVKLREAMGEESFDAFLKDVYETYNGKIADTKGIIKVLREHDGGAEVEKLIAYYIAE